MRIDHGDLLLHDGYNVTAVQTVESDDPSTPVEVHPKIRYGASTEARMILGQLGCVIPEIPLGEALKARDDFAERMRGLGITPDMLADAMFPGLRGVRSR